MKAKRFAESLLRSCVALAGLAAALSCQASAASRIDAEIARLEQTLASVEQSGALPEDVKGLVGAHRTALERATQAGTPAYKLYRLRDPFTGIETLAFLAKEKDSGKSVADFERLWSASRSRFEAAAPPARGTLLTRGLAESATTRAERLFHASLPYAKASAPWSGVYYLGEAEGNVRFREFLQSLGAEEQGGEKTPSREQITAMVEELERSTLAFFAGDVTNQALIPVSVRLKESRELLDAKRLAGAMLLAVEARAALSRRGGPRGSYPADAAVPAESVRSFLEGWAADEEPPMQASLRNDVTPFAGAMFATTAARAKTKPAQVTVTLVRWPYT